MPADLRVVQSPVESYIDLLKKTLKNALGKDAEQEEIIAGQALMLTLDRLTTDGVLAPRTLSEYATALGAFLIEVERSNREEQYTPTRIQEALGATVARIYEKLKRISSCLRSQS
jgi:hypothetical protein